MWSFASNAIATIGLKKNLRQPSQAILDWSDEEVCSNSSREDGLECPICWESFNIIENVPYVLWCGHTLCGNCVLGLQCAVLEFSAQKVKIPLFVSCPWCHLLSLRLIYKGNLQFPCKNFFLLWMVERLNGDRVCLQNQSMCSPNEGPIPGYQDSDNTLRRRVSTQCPGQLGSHGESGDRASRNAERHLSSLHKYLDIFIHFTSKFPFAILFLLVVFLAIPGSACVLLLYLLITIIFAIPSLLVLCFTYPTLAWLLKEIIS